MRGRGQTLEIKTWHALSDHMTIIKGFNEIFINGDYKTIYIFSEYFCLCIFLRSPMPKKRTWTNCWRSWTASSIQTRRRSSQRRPASSRPTTVGGRSPSTRTRAPTRRATAPTPQPTTRPRSQWATRLRQGASPKRQRWQRNKCLIVSLAVPYSHTVSTWLIFLTDLATYQQIFFFFSISNCHV